MKKEKIGSNPILKLTFDFSVEIRDYCDRLNKFKKYTISAQLLEPATFIGANCKEAQHAESRADFIHTIKIAAKETEESRHWLFLRDLSGKYPKSDSLHLKLGSIQKVLNKISGPSGKAGIARMILA